MKAKYYLLIVFALFSSFQSKAQNTLDRIGLTSSTPASVAYSVRQLSTNYTGPLLRVKVGTSFYDVYPDTITSIFSLNSKISAPIGTYNAGVGTATASSLNSIIVSGTTNATVVVWYDQSGNGVNVMTSTATGPKIITQGNIQLMNGMPTIYFAAVSANTSPLVSATTVNFSSQQTATVNAVVQNIGSTSNISGVYSTGLSGGWGLNYGATAPLGYWADGSGCSHALTGVTSNTPKIITGLMNKTTSSSSIYENNVLIDTRPLTCNIDNGVADKVCIGIRAENGGTRKFDGNISEVFLFPSILANANRIMIETDQNTTYFSPFVSITSSATGAICGGESVTFTANAQNFSTTPSYQWYKNGVAISGANSTTYTTTSLANNDQINVTCSTATSIVSDNTLSLWLDAGNSSSYSGSGSTWTDLSGNSNNATLVNSPTFSSANQGSIEFNGTNYGVVNNPSSNLILGTSDFTMSWWQLASTNNPNTRLFGNINNSSWSANNWVVTQNFNAANTIGYYANNSNLYPVLSATTIPQTWQNIVVSRSGNTWSIYLNNVLISSSSSSFSVDGGLSKPFYIGTSGWITSDGYWNGKIANITLYRKALSSTERLQNYNALAGRFGLISSNSFTSNTITTTVTALPSATVTVAGDACIYKTTLSVPTGMTSYAWYKDNAAILGATSDTFIPASAGDYKVVVTNGACNATSATTTITICGLTTDGKMLPITSAATLVSNEGGTNFGTAINNLGTIINTTGLTTTTGTIGATSAVLGGVISAANAIASSFGVIYSTDANFGTYSTATIQSNAASGTYTGTVSGLSASTTYYAKSFVINRAGTSYGPVVSFTTATPPPLVTNGLVLNLDAGNSASYPGTGTTWTDLSGNGNHGTLFNSPAYSATNGGSLSFDVSSKYVSITPSLLPTGTTDRTIIAFVKTPTSMGGYQHIIHWGSTSNNQAFGLAFVNNQISTHIWGPYPTQGGVNVSTATNYCFATTYSNTGTLHKFWINGVSQGLGVSYSINTGTTDARVGMRITGSEGWGPSGQIYQVLVYNRVLSDAEIQQVFNVQRGRFGL